jgi:uncharacterized cupredoxin-like copper-binding protein
MKKTILLAVLAVFMLNVNSQEKKETKKAEKQVTVPAAVKKAFAVKFPTAAKVEWGIEKPGQYEAEFNQNKTGMSALFDTKGTLLETESKISVTELPQSIKSVLAKDYATYKTKVIEKNVVKGVVKYEVVVEKAKKSIELVFDANGKLLKKEADEKD